MVGSIKKKDTTLEKIDNALIQTAECLRELTRLRLEIENKKKKLIRIK